MGNTKTIHDINPLVEYGRAATGILPVIGKPARVAADAPLDRTVYVKDDITIDRAKLQDYCRATGQQYGEILPLTYLFAVEFSTLMQLLTSKSFPFAAIGSVHLRNQIDRKRRIDASEKLTMKTVPLRLQEIHAGITVEVQTDTYVGTELVNTNIATLLHPQRTSLTTEKKGPKPIKRRAQPTNQKLVANQSIIRTYAAASGDRNPIHMSALSAKAFGFSQAIAHGAWSMAAVLPSLEARLPDAVRYNVSWQKPILLPSVSNVYTKPVDDGYDITVLNPATSARHLFGEIRF